LREQDRFKSLRRQIVIAPAAAAVDLGSGGTDQVTIAIKRVQKAWFIVAGIWFKSPQRTFVYEERRLNSAVVSPKSHGAPRAIIRTTVIWNSITVEADQLPVQETGARHDLHRKISDAHSLSCPATLTSTLRAGGRLTTSDVAEAWREGGC
jgi:hypothetical protein